MEGCCGTKGTQEKEGWRGQRSFLRMISRSLATHGGGTQRGRLPPLPCSATRWK